MFSSPGEQSESTKPIVPGIEKYNLISGSLQNLNKLSADLLSEKETLQNYIAELEEERIQYLSNEAMQGNTQDSTKSLELLNKLNEVQQRVSDIEAIHKNIIKKKQGLEAEQDEIYGHCKQELGQYLNDRFSELSGHYHKLAPEISETVLQIQAVQDLMIQLHTGNSNGFDGCIRLPTIDHGNGNTLTPFLENNALRYKAESNDRKQEILTELTAAGYPIRR